MNHAHERAWQLATAITETIMAQYREHIVTALAKNEDISVLIKFEAGSDSPCVRCHVIIPKDSRFYRGAFVFYKGRLIFGDWCQRCAQRIIATTGNPVICHELDNGPNEQTD